MKKVPELLVPAGGMEQLKAAVACGADAVYLGGPSFSARARADNFSENDLKQAVGYAHTCGVKVHVALNTLLTDRELPSALEFAARTYGYGADAVIVQDTGLFSLIRRYLPGLSLHLSTQGTVTDLHGVRAAAVRGADRVILARELSLDEIRTICQSKGSTEIEIFVHGAICIGLSGQCHMSGMAGPRSGNRGDCAQPCRMHYLLKKQGAGTVSEGYQLSPKDQCLLPHLGQIAEAGVDSVKIEGRMKSPEYVAAVTKIYRKHLDFIKNGESATAAGCLPDDVRVLRQIYSRGAFTDTYFRGYAYSGLMSGLSPKHQGLPAGKLSDFQKKTGHAVIRLSEPLAIGDGVEIRGRKGTADNVVTYLRDSKGRMVKNAAKGSTVEAGDLRVKGGIPEKGSPVYKLTDKKLMQELRQEFQQMPQRIPVRFRLKAKEGERLLLEGISEGNGRFFYGSATGETPLETARARNVDPAALKDKLSKTGGTPYHCADIHIDIEGNPFVQVSVLNELRRQVLSELTGKRLEAAAPEEADTAELTRNCRRAFREGFHGAEFLQKKDVLSDLKEPSLQLYFYDTPDLERRFRTFLEMLETWNLEKTRLILCLPLDFFEKSVQGTDLDRMIENSGCRLDVVLPVEMRRTGRTEEDTGALLRTLSGRKAFRAVMIADPGQLSVVRRAGVPFETDRQLNVLNSVTAGYWISEGALSVCLTEEPDAVRSFDFGNNPGGCCVSVYGRVPVMYLEHCPIGSHSHEAWSFRLSDRPCCSDRKKRYYCKEEKWQLCDRNGASYPLEADSRCCRAVVYSHRKIDQTPQKKQLLSSGVHQIRINVYDENAEEIKNCLQKWM